MISSVLTSLVLVGVSMNMVAASDMEFLDLDFQSDLTARSDFENNDILLDFDTPAVEGPGGSLAVNTIDNTPILATLPDGGAQQLASLNPCGIVAAHHHPGATEISHVLSGNLKFTLFEELGGRKIEVDVPKGKTVILPRGLVHLTVNDNCEPGSFLATFPNEDPAAVFAAQTLFQIPANVISGIIGGGNIDEIKRIQEAAVGANPFGILEECRKRCGI